MSTNWWTMTREEFEARKKRSGEHGFPYDRDRIVMPQAKGDPPARAEEIAEYFRVARLRRPAFLQGLADWGHAINDRG